MQANEKKIFYRVGNLETQQGLWYDFDGKFTGLIHDRFDFCTNKDLPMPFNEEVVGWLSAVDKLNDLFQWFTKEDIKQLEEHGYSIGVYEATEYKVHENHWVIKQDNAKHIINLPIETI